MPIGPGNETVIQGLTAPLPSSGPLGEAYGDTTLTGIRIGPWQIDYVVKSGSGGTSTVSVSVDEATRAVSVRLDGPAMPGVGALLKAISANAAKLVVVSTSAKERRRAPPPTPRSAGDAQSDGAREKTPEPDTPRGGESSSLWVLLALVMYLLGLLLGRRELATWWTAIDRHELRAVGGVALATVVMLWVLPETIAYHRGHGWAWAEHVASGRGAEYHNGALALMLTRLLGFWASPGMEAHAAAQVACVLSIPVGWLWARTLWERGPAALLFAGLLACQPALLYLGNSHYVGSIGILMLLLAGFHATLAVRLGSEQLLLCAAGAATWLLSFRFSGVFAAPGIAMIAVAVVPTREVGRRFWVLLVAAVAVAAALAAPRFIELTAVAGQHGELPAPGPYQVWLVSFFSRGHIAAPELFWLGMAGAVGLLALGRRAELPLRPWLATPALLVAIVVPLWFSVAASDGFLDEMRYGPWALPATALAASALLAVVPRSMQTRGIAAGVAVGGLVLALGTWAPAQATALEHPEQLQLRLLHESLERLPQGARVAFPARRDQHRLWLPLTALGHLRPDVSLVRVESPDWKERADFWFTPLGCHVPHFAPRATGPNVVDACTFGAGLRPLHVARVSLEVLDILQPEGQPPMRIDEPYWVSPPVLSTSGPTFIGLFSSRGEFAGARRFR